MKSSFVACLIPSGLILAALFSVPALSLDKPISMGIQCGLTLALVESWPSVLVQRWAWNKKIFYAVWAGAILFRMIFFAATAFVVYRFTNLSLGATLEAMVLATTLFLISESLFLKKQKQ